MHDAKAVFEYVNAYYRSLAYTFSLFSFLVSQLSNEFDSEDLHVKFLFFADLIEVFAIKGERYGGKHWF